MIKALIPFQKRLNRQALLRCAALAAVSGAAVAAVTLLGYRLLTAARQPVIPLAAGTAAALITFFFLYLFVFRANEKKTAAYLDRQGLQERVLTMVTNQSLEDPISQLQRQDALRHIASLSPRGIPVKMPVKSLIALLCIVVLIVPLALIPGPYLGLSSGEDAALRRSQEALLVDQLLEDLRRRIEGSSLSEERRQELLAWLDSLSGDAQIDMKQLADIIAQAQQMEEHIRNEESYGAMMAEMLAQPHFAGLAKAILDADIDEMDAYFDELEAGLVVLEQEPLCEELLQIRSEAMAIQARAEEDEGDTSLIGTFNMLAGGFYLAAIGGFSHEDTIQLVHEDLFQCRLTILAMLQAMNSSASGNVDRERAQTDVSAKQDTHEENGTAAGKTDEDENGIIGGGIDGIASESLGSAVRFIHPDELIWDPERKEVLPYSEVYGKYYLQLLEGTESGLWDENSYDEINRYFNGL